MARSVLFRAPATHPRVYAVVTTLIRIYPFYLSRPLVALVEIKIKRKKKDIYIKKKKKKSRSVVLGLGRTGRHRPRREFIFSTDLFHFRIIFLPNEYTSTKRYVSSHRTNVRTYEERKNNKESERRNGRNGRNGRKGRKKERKRGARIMRPIYISGFFKERNEFLVRRGRCIEI